MKRIIEYLKRHGLLSASGLVIVVGIVAIWLLSVQTLALPLLGDHCMKTSKSIEISYNMVRYKDPFHQYADWQATQDNLFGQTGSIIGYESPLTALLLAGLYLVVDSADFMTRVNTARFFALFHLLGAYVLLAFFFFRKDLFALLVFSVVLIVSTFTISYSMQPFVESTALLYQAILLVAAWRLVQRPLSPIKKTLLLAIPAFLLCVGGKMNYFLIGLPVIIGFPFIDRTLKGLKPKATFLAVFAMAGGVLVIALLLFSDLDFKSIFVYMIKGNKPIINDSLWDTFLEGFSAFDELKNRTKEDFGYLPYQGGVLGMIYLGLRFVALPFVKRRTPLTPFDHFQRVLFLVVLGHWLNYIVLRNLYIPHRYYVIPLYTVFCLTFTALVADIRTLLFHPLPFKTRLFEKVSARLPEPMRARLRTIDTDAVRRNSAFILIVFCTATAAVLGYAAYVFHVHRNWQTTFVLASKSLGSDLIAIELLDRLAGWVTVLTAASIGLAVVAMGTAVVWWRASAGSAVRAVIDRGSAFLARYRITASALLMGIFLTAITGYSTLKTARYVHHYALRYLEHIDNAKALAKIRNDTTSGDLVLCWKWCIAFYADKRSFTDASVKDLTYYRKNDIHSVMGPEKPLNHYYERIEKYDNPMSYWRPLSPKEVKARRAEKARKRKEKAKKK